MHECLCKGTCTQGWPHAPALGLPGAGGKGGCEHEVGPLREQCTFPAKPSFQTLVFASDGLAGITEARSGEQKAAWTLRDVLSGKVLTTKQHLSRNPTATETLAALNGSNLLLWVHTASERKLFAFALNRGNPRVADTY